MQENGESPLKVLIAEDDLINQRLMGMMVDRMGHFYDTAVDGQGVLNKLREAPFDVVLLDMHMPVMDGYEVLKEIRGDPELSSLMVIAYTATSMEGEEETFLSAGCDDYLPKPVDKKVLAEKLEKARIRSR